MYDNVSKERLHYVVVKSIWDVEGSKPELVLSIQSLKATV